MIELAQCLVPESFPSNVVYDKDIPRLEHAIRKWKLKLTDEGSRLGHDTALANLRYADDLMIFETSREKLVCMVETLAQEFPLIGLQLNGTKTNVLTTSALQEASSYEGSYVEISGAMYGCSFARRNDTQISAPQIPWRCEFYNRSGNHDAMCTAQI